VRPVADEVAAAVDVPDPQLVETSERRLERGEVAVDVGEDRYALHGFRV
jgi:hypothetical protein